METTLLPILEINNGVDYGQKSLVLNNGALFSFFPSFLPSFAKYIYIYFKNKFLLSKNYV